LLKAYRGDGAAWSTGDALKQGIIWVDLIDPTEEEKREVERIIAIRVPSKASLSEIEASSRLIFEHDVLYLSSPAVRMNDAGEAELTPVGFIVNKNAMVTVRFSELPAFDAVLKRVESDHDLQTGMCVFTALAEAIVDRGADVLEHLGAEADRLSRSVFKGGMDKRKGPMRATRRLREALSNVGVLADRLAMARDVLLGVGRIASYANDVAEDWITKSSKHRLQAVLKDVASLNDYETRLSDKIQMLLDAVLGFINIEQNDLFKILTIVSVVGVPPTLLAGIWGMNFKHMPELDWAWGYPLAWLAIILSGVAPLIWFRMRGWWER
jgi:magnesium transporter